jgi:glycosyltransferase involved in cell wall biosynthesis
MRIVRREPSGRRVAGVIVYRGPWQKNRIRLALRALVSDASMSSVTICWLMPKGGGPKRQADAEYYTSAPGYEAIGQIRLLDGRLSHAPAARRHLRHALPDLPTIVIGDSAKAFVPAAVFRRSIWLVQGIPDEALEHHDTWLRRCGVAAAWMSLRRGPKPRALIVPTRPMARLMRERLPGVPTDVIPNSVDVAVFRAVTQPHRVYATYLGSGAPWQGVDELSAVWGHLADLDPELRFRVISRDERTKVLGSRVEGGRVEYTASVEQTEIARLLAEARIGFLLRADTIVNRVAGPIKFGEYLAAQVPVVVSDLEWEPAYAVRETGMGLLVPRGETAEATARRIAAFLSQGDDLRVNAERDARLEEYLLRLNAETCATALRSILAVDHA